MVQSTTQRASSQGILRLFFLLALGVIVLSAVYIASPGSSPAAAKDTKIVDQNGDHVINAKDLILLLEDWSTSGFSVTEMLQVGQSWQETDFNTPTPTFTCTLTDTSTFTLTPTEETEFDTPTPTVFFPAETPTATEETVFDTPTKTPRPTSTVTPTRTPTFTPVDLELYYYSNGKKRYVHPSRTRISVIFEEGVDSSERQAFLDRHPELSAFERTYPDATDGKWRIGLSRSIEWAELAGLFDILNEDPVVKFPAFIEEVALGSIYYTNAFGALFLPSLSNQEILDFIENSNVEIIQPGSLQTGWTYRLRPRGVKDIRDIFKAANLFFESGKVEFAVPISGGGSLGSIPPNDPLYGWQWHLNNTGQDPPGGYEDADIDAPEGWSLQTGMNNVVIAIIDSGIDMNHPDLTQNIWINPSETPGNGIDDDGNGFTDDLNGWDFVDPTNNPPDDQCGHGTAVAGLAAARTDNGIGVAGVAWECKLMPVKVTDATGNLSQDNTLLEQAIRYAVNNGADVLNMSWTIQNEYDAYISSALKYARTIGRCGKGCVCVFCAGNDAVWSIPYPSSSDNVIAVGASNKNDSSWWYSNSGEQLDVVAPSNGYDLNNGTWDTLVTTDILGPYGINTNGQNDFPNLDYTMNAWGTSSSAPQVSGLAALLLSQNPNLTAAEIQSLIQASADDLLWEIWDDLTAWGRINVYNALATATPGISRFEIKDEALGEGIAFDEFGFLYLSGRIKGAQLPEPDNTPIPTPNPNKTEFVILNASQTPVAIVDIAEGDLYIKGSVNTRQPVPTPNPNKGEFYLSNAQSTPVALINEDGDLYLERQYYNESYP